MSQPALPVADRLTNTAQCLQISVYTHSLNILHSVLLVHHANVILLMHNGYRVTI